MGIAKGVFAAGALLLIGTISVRAQQVADSATPSIGDSRPLLNQRDVVSAFDAAIDQDPQQATNESQTAVTTDDNNNTIPAMFPHFQNDRIWISGQANFISQWHPAFHSPYSGKNSLSAQAQDATSRVLTLFTGLRLTSTSELLCDIQEHGGHGHVDVRAIEVETVTRRHHQPDGGFGAAEPFQFFHQGWQRAFR